MFRWKKGKSGLPSSMETTLEQLIAIDVIASEILKKLERKDLLKCSLLNKQWNKLTRDYLYRTENLSIQLVLIRKLRKTNLDRLNWLQNSEQKLFKQLNLRIDTFFALHNCDQDVWPVLLQLRQAPIVAPGITSVEVDDNCPHNEKCEVIEFVRSVLQNLPTYSIKKLNAGYVKDFEWYFIKNEQFIFPGLETIQLSEYQSQYVSLIPSLKEYTGEVLTRQLGTILDDGNVHLVKYLTLDALPNSESSEMDVLLKFAEQQPQLKGLTISDTQIRDLILSRNKGLKIFFLSILNSSYLSLMNIQCKTDLRVLSTISQISDKSFPAVKSFIFPQQQLFEAKILGSISLSKIFPNLSTVIVSHVKDFKIGRDVFEGAGESHGNRTYKSVKNLIYRCNYGFRSEYNEIFAGIFPNIRDLKYEFANTDSALESICSSLWSGVWKQLEDLSMSLIPKQLSECEWCFLGISEEELRYWKELKNTGVDLADMQFAPSDFSVANLTDTNIWLKIPGYSKRYLDYSTEILELVEVERNLFLISARVGSTDEPENINSSDTTEPLVALRGTPRLIRGIRNILSRFKYGATTFATSFYV